jgi:hypothetical protein
MHLLKLASPFWSIIVLTSGSILPESASQHNSIEKRQQFASGEPIDASGKGGPILGKFSRCLVNRD